MGTSTYRVYKIASYLVLLFIWSHLAGAQSDWIETTQNDFADGICEHNIYASHLDGGTVEFTPRFDLNNDGYLEIVTCEIGGQITLYWGSASGYNPGNSVIFPGSGAGDIDISDVDCDGFADFIVTHANSDSRLAIYWGSAIGPTPGNVFNIPNSPSVPNEAVYTADLNKDGYLDIIIGAYYSLNTGVIFWGSASGYSPSNNTQLPTLFGAHNVEVADLNKDDWLDIVFVNNDGSDNYIYWGSITGYSPGNITRLPAPIGAPHGVSIADVNSDGYLDIIFTAVFGSSAYIYYGSSSGYSTYQSLNTDNTYGGSAVWNFNSTSDEYLDIVFYRGGGLQPIIYWGSATGYSDTDTMIFGYGMNASGGYAADFNDDGDFDVFINSRSSALSSIFWGPDFATYDIIANLSDHHALFREIGNTYTRELYEDYLSSIYDAGQETDWGIIEWDDSLPPQSDIYLSVRTGNTPAPDSTWSSWDSMGNGQDIPDSLTSRYIQYRARMMYENPAYLPFLYEVRIALGPAVMILLEPDQADSTLPGQAASYPVDVININVGDDTIDLDYFHTTAWQVILYDSTGLNPLIDNNGNGFVDVAVDSNDTIGIVVEVTPYDSAQGGEIDSLTVVGTSNIIPTEQDSVHLTTTVMDRISILVEPDQISYTSPGVSVQFPTMVINDGTRNDTVDLYYTHNQPWGISLLDSTGTLPLTDHNGNGIPDVMVNSSDTTDIIVEVFPPGSASPGDADTLILTGRSTVDPLVTDDVQLITIIQTAGTIIVYPDQSANGTPDTWVQFDLTCRNNQSFMDTIDLALFDQMGWSYNLMDSLGNALIDNNGNGMVDLPGVPASGGEVDFVTSIYIPSGAPNGTIDSVLLFGYSGQDTMIQDSSVLVVTVGSYVAVLIEPDQADSGANGSIIDYPCYVQNLGNSIDTIDLAVISGSFIYSLRDINGNLLFDSNGNGMVDVGGLDPFTGESILVRVQVTGTQPGYIDTAIVRAYSSINQMVSDDVRLQTRVIGSVWGLSLEPDQEAVVEIGQTAVLYVDARLLGSISDVVDLRADVPTGDWTVTLTDSSGVPLSDTDGDGEIDLGIVTPSIPTRFQVLVNSPYRFELIGDVDTIVACAFYVHGKCSMVESITDSVFLRVRLVPPFDVHNFRNPFRSQTQFIFSVPKNGSVTLEIYNRVGELVRRLINHQYYDFGVHYYPWDGCNSRGERLKPGTYIYIMDFTATDGDHHVAKKKAIILE